MSDKELVRTIFPEATLWRFDPNAPRYFVTSEKSLDSGVRFLNGYGEWDFTEEQAWRSAKNQLLALCEYHAPRTSTMVAEPLASLSTPIATIPEEGLKK